MVTNISRSPEETAALGFAWGQEAQSGWVIALCGDLGAGKTQLVKGLARGLGSPARVQSPTFALVNHYPGGRLPLFHLDLYRLETREQILGAGLEEYLHPAGVAVIEWAERWFGQPPAQPAAPPPAAAPALALAPAAPPPRLRWVTLEALAETERRITHHDEIIGF
jgi:tRNA threonylcarbamoyladenosine biosynthesis protein TsaE